MNNENAPDFPMRFCFSLLYCLSAIKYTIVVNSNND